MRTGVGARGASMREASKPDKAALCLEWLARCGPRSLEFPQLCCNLGVSRNGENATPQLRGSIVPQNRSAYFSDGCFGRRSCHQHSCACLTFVHLLALAPCCCNRIEQSDDLGMPQRIELLLLQCHGGAALADHRLLLQDRRLPTGSEVTPLSQAQIRETLPVHECAQRLCALVQLTSSFKSA